MNTPYLAGLAGLAFLMATGCGSTTPVTANATKAAAPSAAASAPEPPAGLVVLGADAPELKQMTVEAVAAIPLPAQEITAPARIEVNPNRVGHATLPAQGRATQVLVKLGDFVRQGQPVVAMESPMVAEAESAFVLAENAVSQAELTAAKADADEARHRDLFEHQAVAKKDLLAAETAAKLSKAALEQTRNMREQARRRLEVLGLKAGQTQQHLVVVAPLSGKVLEVKVVPGEFVNEINTPLVTIADLSRVWATSEVPESEIRFCQIGGVMELSLISYPNEFFRARVTRIADTVNPETRTIKVSAELDNSAGRLRPEMFGQLRYSDGNVPTLWVPDSAVVRMGEKTYVFVQRSPGHFQATLVELGKSRRDGFAVLSGLKAGEQIVTKGAVYLKGAL